jgi:hypothetical protein
MSLQEFVDIARVVLLLAFTVVLVVTWKWNEGVRYIRASWIQVAVGVGFVALECLDKDPLLLLIIIWCLSIGMNLMGIKWARRDMRDQIVREYEKF